MAERWYAGSSEEWFGSGPFDSREEAISEGRSLWPDRAFFFVGRAGEYKPFTRDYVEELLELEACDVADECGLDASDNWPPPLDSRSEAYREANVKIVAILRGLSGECTVSPIVGSERIEQEAR